MAELTTGIFDELLPPLSTEEFAALKADIEANGVMHPVFVDEEGNVLDGRHRLKINPDAKKKVIRGLSPAEKKAFVLRYGSNHRNMSPDQKKEVRDKCKAVAKELRDEDPAKWTNERIGAELGVAESTVRLWESESMPNRSTANTHNPPPKPDARVKLSEPAKAKLVAEVKAGESQVQVAANYGVNQSQVSRILTADKKKREKEAAERAAVKAAKSAIAKLEGVISGDFREVGKKIPDKSVSLIFTDPPYDRKSLPMYGDLAELASRILIPGGSLICYLGQYQMDKVMELITPHMRLWWTLAVVHGGDCARMTNFGVIVKWKPLLWFVKETRRDNRTFVDDLVYSSQEKDTHDWQQSEREASYYIEKLTKKGEVVFDPFCGGGTTAVAAKRIGRKFITCDTNENSLAKARKRIHDAGIQ